MKKKTLVEQWYSFGFQCPNCKAVYNDVYANKVCRKCGEYFQKFEQCVLLNKKYEEKRFLRFTKYYYKREVASLVEYKTQQEETP